MAKQSGISDLPSFLPHPKAIDLSSCGAIKGLFCYIIRHYGNIGVSILYHRTGDETRLIAGDWDGNIIDLADQKHPHMRLAHIVLSQYGQKIIDLGRAIQITQAMYYLTIDAGKFILVDVQLSLNKFAGPGMVRDVFGKIFNTPEVISIEILDEKALDGIASGAGKYSGDLILKPSRFRTIVHEKTLVPLYAEVVRC